MLYYEYELIYNRYTTREDAGLHEFNRLEKKWVKKKDNSRKIGTVRK